MARTRVIETDGGVQVLNGNKEVLSDKTVQEHIRNAIKGSETVQKGRKAVRAPKNSKEVKGKATKVKAEKAPKAPRAPKVAKAPFKVCFIRMTPKGYGSIEHGGRETVELESLTQVVKSIQMNVSDSPEGLHEIVIVLRKQS